MNIFLVITGREHTTKANKKKQYQDMDIPGVHSYRYFASHIDSWLLFHIRGGVCMVIGDVLTRRNTIQQTPNIDVLIETNSAKYHHLCYILQIQFRLLVGFQQFGWCL